MPPRLPFDPVLVGEGLEHVRDGNHGAGPGLEHLVTRQIVLRVLLGACGELLAVGGLTQRGPARIDRHVLEALAAHHGPETAARGVAGRVSILLLIGAGHRRPGEAQLARGADADEGSGLRVSPGQLLDEGVVPEALAVGYLLHAPALRVDVHRVALVGIGGLALHDDRPVAELHEILAGIAAGVGLLDPARQGALPPDRDATRGRGGRARQHTGRHHQHVVGAERIAAGIAFFQEDAGRQCPATQELPLLGEGVDAHRLAAHVHA
jgi:hypothetical protein